MKQKKMNDLKEKTKVLKDKNEQGEHEKYEREIKRLEREGVDVSSSEEEEPPKTIQKKKKRRKPKIVIEQDDSSEEEIVVRRVRRESRAFRESISELGFEWNIDLPSALAS